MDWGWGVFGGGVVWGWGRVVRFGFGVDRDTFVFDISDITVVVISGVGHSLDTAIGKSNLVRSRDSFACWLKKCKHKYLILSFDTKNFYTFWNNNCNKVIF